jgi:hypothetical protein
MTCKQRAMISEERAKSWWDAVTAMFAGQQQCGPANTLY